MSTGIIYKICNESESIVYIGSTTQTLNTRWSIHKSKYKRWLDGKNSCCMIYHSFKEHGLDAFHIEVIEEIKFEDKCELLKLENHYISTTKCINKKVSYTGISTDDKQEYQKEYQKDNKDKISEQKKQYRQANREKILEQKKQKFNCDCGGKYTYCHKSEHERSKKHQNYLETL